MNGYLLISLLKKKNKTTINLISIKLRTNMKFPMRQIKMLSNQAYHCAHFHKRYKLS